MRSVWTRNLIIVGKFAGFSKTSSSKSMNRVLGWLPLILIGVCASGQSRILTSNRYHLGVTGKPEWLWFEGRTPFSNRLDIHFAAQTNRQAATLRIRQEDVKLDWTVQLNGRKLGTLFLMEQPLVHTL